MYRLNKQNLGTALLLFALCWLLFGRTLDYPFMMDDKALITRNTHLFDAGFLQLDFLARGAPKEEGAAYVYFRPVTQALNALPAYLFGKDPYAYRQINLFLFYLVCLSVYELLNVLFKNFYFSLLGAALFCLHPLNGVLVTYISATGYSVLVLSMNLGLLCLWRAEEKRQGWYFIPAAFFYILALLCHETAVAFPLYWAAVLFFAGKRSKRYAFLSCLPLAVIALAYYFFRQHYAPYAVNFAGRLDFIGLSLAGYLASFSQCVFWYLKALLFAGDVVLMWSPPAAAGIAVFLWIAGLAGALALLIYLIFFRWRDERGLGLSWIFIGALPVAFACLSRPTLGVIIEPHWLFFSTMGFCIFLSCVLTRVYGRVQRGMGLVLKGLSLALIIFVAGFYAAASLYYNALWADEKKYCHYMHDLSPGMHLPAFWLGDAYMQEGDWEKAKEFYLKSVKGFQIDWEAYVNLGLIERELGDARGAKDYYKKALRLNPAAVEPKNNLAAIYIDEGKFAIAEPLLKEVIRRDGDFISAKKNLAVLYERQGRREEARKITESINK